MSARLSLMKIINQFRTMCQSGKKVYESDLRKAFDQFEADVRDIYAGRDHPEIAAGRYIMNQFASKVANQKFGYCSCKSFASQIGKTNEITAAGNTSCQSKCGGGSSTTPTSPPATTCRRVRECPSCKYVRVRKYKCSYIRGRRSCGTRYVTERQCPPCKYVTKCGNTLAEDETVVEEIITLE